MEQAGHKCLGFIEINKFAVRSYRAIHNTEGEFYANDIRNVRPEDLPEADVYCGGFPCQSFSVSGKRGGFEDTRGTLFFEIMRLASIRKPKYLFLENVAGLLSHEGGKTFETLLKTLWACGYDAQWELLNACHYEIPQNRERLFIVGYLRGTCRRQIFPIAGETSETLKQVVSGNQAYKVYDSNGLARTIMGSGGAKTGLYFVTKNQNDIKIRKYCTCLDANYYKGLNCHQKRTGVLEVRPILTPDRINKRQNGRRLKNDGEPMFTLTTQDRHRVLINEDDSIHIRRLTPKETWRLQGFPDKCFERARKINSDRQLYKQAGNAVVIPVIYAIAKKLK